MMRALVFIAARPGGAIPWHEFNRAVHPWTKSALTGRGLIEEDQYLAMGESHDVFRLTDAGRAVLSATEA